MNSGEVKSEISVWGMWFCGMWFLECGMLKMVLLFYLKSKICVVVLLFYEYKLVFNIGLFGVDNLFYWCFTEISCLLNCQIMSKESENKSNPTQ